MAVGWGFTEAFTDSKATTRNPKSVRIKEPENTMEKYSAFLAFSAVEFQATMGIEV